MILQSLAGLPAFLVYFCTAIIAVVVYLFVYTRITPHDEFKLIRDNDPAAAIALGLSLLGFTLPVVSAIAHSSNIVDCLVWSLVALIVQVVVYFVIKIPVPNLSAKIAAGELAPAIWLGLSSLAAGALNRGIATRQALPPCRAALDRHAGGRRRRLCAHAPTELRTGRPWHSSAGIAAGHRLRNPRLLGWRPWRLWWKLVAQQFLRR
jgi:putative membrane protein